MKPGITISYCPKCGWLLRAAYMAQELLVTFEEDLTGVTLKPSEIAGSYQVSLNDQIIFDRKRDGHFPEIKELKQRVRDLVNPGKSLGHADRKKEERGITDSPHFWRLIGLRMIWKAVKILLPQKCRKGTRPEIFAKWHNFPFPEYSTTPPINSFQASAFLCLKS